MKSFFKLLPALLLSLFVINCPTHKDKVTQKNVINFMILCRGGSVTACNDTCNVICGTSSSAPMAPANLPCLSSCQGDCKSNCDLSTTILLYTASK